MKTPREFGRQLLNLLGKDPDEKIICFNVFVDFQHDVAEVTFIEYADIKTDDGVPITQLKKWKLVEDNEIHDCDMEEE